MEKNKWNNIDELNNASEELNNEELNNLITKLEGENKTDNSDTKETKIQYIIIPFIIICLIILISIDIADTDSFLIQEYSGEYDVQYVDEDITDGVYDWNEYYNLCRENGIALSYANQSVNYIIIRRTSNDKFRNRECTIG